MQDPQDYRIKPVEEHDLKLARPALNEVRELALRERTQRAELASLRRVVSIARKLDSWLSPPPNESLDTLSKAITDHEAKHGKLEVKDDG